MSELYRYAHVEKALASVHRIEENGVRALRALLVNVKTLGLEVDKPGKGKNVDYAFRDVALLGCALEMLQAGFAPRVAVEIIVEAGDALERELVKAARSGPRYMVIFPYIVTDRLSETAEPSGHIEFIGDADLPKLLARGAKRHERRTLIIDLSALHHALTVALQAAVESEGRVVEYVPPKLASAGR